jgi:hypothetical protein
LRANEYCLKSEILSDFLLSLQEEIKINDCEYLRQISVRAVSAYKPHDDIADNLMEQKLVNNDAINMAKIR